MTARLDPDRRAPRSHHHAGGATITLSALDGGPAGNPRLVRVWRGWTQSYWAVELRTSQGWDRNTGVDAVLVRRVQQRHVLPAQATSGNTTCSPGDP